MGKFIKGIIFLIIFFIFIVIIGVGIIVFYTYDNEPISYDVNGSYSSVETIISRDLYKSLEEIENSNYENNELVLEFSIDDLNNYLVEIFRENINEKYLIEEDYIIQESGFSLDSLLFVEGNGGLAIKLRFSAYQFYASTITYSAAVSINSNNALQIFLGDLVLGNHIKVSSKIINKIVGKFSDKLEGVSNFDTETMSMVFDLKDIISSYLNNELFDQLINSCNWSVKIENSILYLVIDTSKVFDSGRDTSNVDYDSVYTSFKTKVENIEMATNIDLVISEEEYSAILYNQLKESLLDYEKTFGNDEYPLTISMEGFEYDLATDTLYTVLQLNDVKTTVKLVLYTKANSNNINIQLNNGYIGQINIIDFDEVFQGIVIDADTVLSSSNIVINDISIDKINEQITMNLSVIF